MRDLIRNHNGGAGNSPTISNNMSPTLSPSNFPDCFSTLSNPYCNLCRGEMFDIMQSPDFKDERVGELSAKMLLSSRPVFLSSLRMFFALRLPVPFNSVVGIVLGSAKRKVFGASTNSNIASVSHLKSSRDFSVCVSVRESVDVPLLIVNRRDSVPDSVPIVFRRPLPNPTIAKVLRVVRRWCGFEFLPKDFWSGFLSVEHSHRSPT